MIGSKFEIRQRIFRTHRRYTLGAIAKSQYKFALIFRKGYFPRLRRAQSAQCVGGKHRTGGILQHDLRIRGFRDLRHGIGNRIRLFFRRAIHREIGNQRMIIFHAVVLIAAQREYHAERALHRRALRIRIGLQHGQIGTIISIYGDRFGDAVVAGDRNDRAAPGVRRDRALFIHRDAFRRGGFIFQRAARRIGRVYQQIILAQVQRFAHAQLQIAARKGDIGRRIEGRHRAGILCRFVAARICGNGGGRTRRHRLHRRQRTRNRINRYIFFAVAGITDFIQRAFSADRVYGKAGIAHADFHVFIAVNRYLTFRGRGIDRKRIGALQRAVRLMMHLNFRGHRRGHNALHAEIHRIRMQIGSHIHARNFQQIGIVGQVRAAIAVFIVLDFERSFHRRADCAGRRFDRGIQLKVEYLQRDGCGQAARRAHGQRRFAAGNLRGNHAIRTDGCDVRIGNLEGNLARVLVFRTADQLIQGIHRIEHIRAAAGNAAHAQTIRIETKDFIRIADIYAAGHRQILILRISGGDRYIIYSVIGVLMRRQRAVRRHGNIFRMAGFIGKFARAALGGRGICNAFARAHPHRASCEVRIGRNVAHANAPFVGVAVLRHAERNIAAVFKCIVRDIGKRIGKLYLRYRTIGKGARRNAGGSIRNDHPAQRGIPVERLLAHRFQRRGELQRKPLRNRAEIGKQKHQHQYVRQRFSELHSITSIKLLHPHSCYDHVL